MYYVLLLIILYYILYCNFHLIIVYIIHEHSALYKILLSIIIPASVEMSILFSHPFALILKAITGERFTGDVVPILVSDVKTRKKDCAVCSNRKAGRRSRSSTMCPHCNKGLHRICAPQHICPMINLPQEFTEMVSP